VVSAATYDHGYDPKRAAPRASEASYATADPYLDSPYAQPGQNVRTFGPMPAATSSLAIGSMIAGILSWVMIPILAAIVAVVLGHMARREVRDSRGHLTGDGMALVGMVLGYIQLGLVAIAILVAIFFVIVGSSLAPR
jgi:hypothetical protein